MANWRGHVVGAGVCTTLYVAMLYTAPNETIQQTHGLLTDWQMLVGLYVIAVLFGLWPDVDTNSKGQNIFFGIAFVADILDTQRSNRGGGVSWARCHDAHHRQTPRVDAQ